MDLTNERTIDGLITTGVVVRGAPVPGYPGRSEPDRTRYIGSYRVRYSQDGLTWIWVYNRSGRLKVFPGHSQVRSLQTAADQPGLGPEAVGGKTAAGRLTWNDVKDIRHNTFVFFFVGFKPCWSALAIAGVWDVCRGRLALVLEVARLAP